MNKNSSKWLGSALIAVSLVSLSACKQETESSSQSASKQTSKSESCRDCGVVTSVSSRRVEGEGSGIGAVTGAVIGGVVGHQIGGGRGKDVATGVGAVGGAVAGHEIEKQSRSTTVYDVAVRMESGGERRFTFGSDQSLREGDRVRVSGDRLTRI